MDGLGKGSSQIGQKPAIPSSLRGEGSAATERKGSFKGKKVSITKNPIKWLLQKITSKFSKSNKGIMTRSVSLPDLSSQKSTVSSGLKRSESLQHVRSSEPVVLPTTFSSNGSNRSQAVDSEATAKNTLKQLDALEQTSGALDPKTVGNLFVDVLTHSIVSEHIVEFSTKLGEEGRDSRPDVHKEMKSQVDSAIDHVLKEYPSIKDRLKREDSQDISRQVQSSAFDKMASKVWTTSGADTYAENSSSELEDLAKWALKPEKIISPRPQGVINFSKGIQARKVVGVSAKPTQAASAEQNTKKQTKSINQRTVATAETVSLTPAASKQTVSQPEEVKSQPSIQQPSTETTKVKSETVISNAAPASGTVEPAKSGEVSNSQPADVSDAFSSENLESFGKVIKDFAANRGSQLSSYDAAMASNLLDKVRGTDVTEEQAQQITQLYKDAVTVHGLNSDQALTVAVETSNWLNDEENYSSESVFSAGHSLTEWLKAGETEASAVTALTEWLEDENWDTSLDDEIEGDIQSTGSNETTLAAAGSVSAPDAPPPPPPPPPPIAPPQTAAPAKEPTDRTAVSDTKATPQAEKSSDVQDLLAAIRGGTTLKKVENNPDVKETFSEMTSGTAAALSRAISADKVDPLVVFTESLVAKFGDLTYDGDVNSEELKTELKTIIDGSDLMKTLTPGQDADLDSLVDELMKVDRDDDDSVKGAVDDWTFKYVEGSLLSKGNTPGQRPGDARG